MLTRPKAIQRTMIKTEPDWSEGSDASGESGNWIEVAEWLGTFQEEAAEDSRTPKPGGSITA